MFSFWGFWSANLRFEIRALRMLRVFWLVHIRIFKGVFCITCFDKTFEKLKNKVLFYGLMLLMLCSAPRASFSGITQINKILGRSEFFKLIFTKRMNEFISRYYIRSQSKYK